jgi:hypothetical protein
VIVSRSQPSYASCLRISKKLQDHSMPDITDSAELNVQQSDHPKTVQVHALYSMKEATLLLLHRDFCSRALVEATNDDYSQSRHAESVDVT